MCVGRVRWTDHQLITLWTKKAWWKKLHFSYIFGRITFIYHKRSPKERTEEASETFSPSPFIRIPHCRIDNPIFHIADVCLNVFPVKRVTAVAGLWYISFTAQHLKRLCSDIFWCFITIHQYNPQECSYIRIIKDDFGWIYKLCCSRCYSLSAVCPVRKLNVEKSCRTSYIQYTYLQLSWERLWSGEE